MNIGYNTIKVYIPKDKEQCENITCNLDCKGCCYSKEIEIRKPSNGTSAY